MPSTWRLWKKRAELAQRAEDARAEADQSRRRLERGQEEVVRPLRRAAAENRFATLVRDSLLNGD